MTIQRAVSVKRKGRSVENFKWTEREKKKEKRERKERERVSPSFHLTRAVTDWWRSTHN